MLPVFPESKQYRIGNYFINANDQLDQVTKLTEQYVHGVEWGIPSPSATGVPLTEEWLVRLGFERSADIGHSTEFYFPGTFDFKIKILRISGWVILGENLIRLPNDYNYVHQIQNLYYDLTGTELPAPRP